VKKPFGFLAPLVCLCVICGCAKEKSRRDELLAGKEALVMGRDEESLEIFAGLEKRNPRDTEARIWKIRALTLLGCSKEAAGELDRETAFNPGDWRLYFQGALIVGRTGDMEKRIAMLKSAETCLKDSARVYVELAKVWYSLGVSDRAQEMISRAQAVSPEGAFSESLATLDGLLAGEKAAGKSTGEARNAH
jgi:tetratricopeptide (TPR) repeat protein